MSSTRRRIAALEDFVPSSTLFARDLKMERATETSSTSEASSTIAPFGTGLSGVDQPVNMLFKDMLWWSFGLLALTVLLIRLGQIAWSKLRQVSAMSMTGEKQGYWKESQWNSMPSLKKNLIYAPLWRKRHNREIKLSGAVSIGTLPSRAHFILLTLYLISNTIYMFFLQWSKQNKYSLIAEVRGRSGTLAAVNMVPLIILAGRNNPLISWLKVSFDTYNLLHRWIGRMVVIETIIHMAAWAAVQVADGGWDLVWHKIVHDDFISSGMVGTVALGMIFILSLSPIRHAFYETFLNVHIVLAFITFVCTWVHCVTAELPGGLPQTTWLIGIFGLWFSERLARMIRLVTVNWSTKGTTEAVIEPMPDNACRVTMHLPRHIDVQPGTHAYIRFLGVNPWENHPFSIAWVHHHPETNKRLPVKEVDEFTNADIKRGTTSVSFVIGAQTGFTRKLYNTACKSGGRSIRMRAALEGPYAGHHSLDSYGHVVLFAGATGITHQISYLRHLIQGYSDGTIATRKITLIWTIRNYDALEWIRPWMDEVLRMPNRKDILTIKIFITRPKNTREVVSASNTVQMHPGRPNAPDLLKKEVQKQVGAMAVTVCGPGGMADDVREAVREVQDAGTVVDFVEESFTW